MKKKLLAILLCVAIIASLSVGLTACKKKNNENNTAGANSTALGTAVAMLAESATATAAGDGEAKTGLNLNFGTSGAISSTFNLSVKPIVEMAISQYLETAAKIAERDSVTVTKNSISSVDLVHKDYDGYIEVKIKSQDKNGKDVFTSYKLYYKATKEDGTKVDIDSKEEFQFSAGLQIDGTDITIFEGTASYDNEKKEMVFNFILFGVNADVIIEDAGTIEVRVGYNETITMVDSIDVTGSAGIKIGVLDDNKYGAKVDIAVGATKNTLDKICDVDVELEIIEDTSKDAENDYTVNGKLKVDVYDLEVSINANVTGYANYDYDAQSQEATFSYGLSGDATAIINTQFRAVI